jgi:hypothetical protein
MITKRLRDKSLTILGILKQYAPFLVSAAYIRSAGITSDGELKVFVPVRVPCSRDKSIAV